MAKRKDKLGTLIFMDSTTHEILIWKHIQSEKVADYKCLLNEITVHPESGKESYTHKKLVAAHKSIRRNLALLLPIKTTKNYQCQTLQT